MLRALRQLFSDQPRYAAHELYVQLVSQSRKPNFYSELGAPDTVDGRFDVIVMHLFLVIHRLRREAAPEAAEFIRLLSEVFFADMDQSLREMGSTDTGVGYRIKKMVTAFYGRLNAYERAIGNTRDLEESLKRNLFREGEVQQSSLAKLAVYMQGNAEALGRQSVADLLAGKITFTN